VPLTDIVTGQGASIGRRETEVADVRDQISEVLYKAISAAMNKPVAELTDATQLVADLGAKSANLVRIISVLEDELDLDVPFQEISRKKTIGDIIAWLVELAEA
jgi:acyl carrier protein